MKKEKIVSIIGGIVGIWLVISAVIGSNIIFHNIFEWLGIPYDISSILTYISIIIMVILLIFVFQYYSNEKE